MSWMGLMIISILFKQKNELIKSSSLFNKKYLNYDRKYLCRFFVSYHYNFEISNDNSIVKNSIFFQKWGKHSVVINQNSSIISSDRTFVAIKDVVEIILLISFLLGIKCSETTSPPIEQQTYRTPVVS